MVPLSLRRALAATAVFLVATFAAAHAQQDKEKKADRLEKGEGVIVSVEPLDNAKDSGRKANRKNAAKRVKLTVNTAAVWRDYIRDQADLASKLDAKKGEESVATKGQPATPESTIVAEVGPDTKVLMRYRSSTDESNSGSRTVEKAEKKDGSPESSEVKTSRRDDKAPKLAVGDLKPGLFVLVDAKKGRATEIIVLKPVGEGTTPASESAKKK